MAELAAAGIFAAGSYGARRLYQYQKKMGYGNPPTSVPLTKTDANAVNIYKLRRMVMAQRPQINNWLDNANINQVSSASPLLTEYSLTSRYISSTGAGSFQDQVLGNKFQNIRSVFRFDIPTVCPRARVIVYWSRKAGNPTSISNFWNQLDPDAFVVVYDKVLKPHGAVAAGSVSNVHQFALNHRGKGTRYNESSSVLETGDLRMAVIWEHAAASAQTVTWTHRLFVRNK